MARAVGIDLGTTNSAIAVLATQVVEDVLRIGQACRWRDAHACQVTGPVNAATLAQACRFC